MAWRILNSSRYRVYQPAPSENSEMRAAVLRVDEDGNPTGDFRVALGGEAVRVEVWSNDLFEHKSLRGFNLVLHINVDDIDLRNNSLSSKWDDLEDQVGRGLIRVTRQGSADDQGPAFRKALEEWRKTNPDEGAATRWIVQKRGPQQLKLSLQALPATAKRLRRDERLSNLAGGAIHLFTVPLIMEIEEHGDYKGPDAVLFTQNKDAVASVLEKEQQRPLPGKETGGLIILLVTKDYNSE
jgi:hypothetical protein